ncbi:hypothetical protein [Lacticaseibacillus rhamnosus]|uniref:hypothetical protein n=1 Tax=Lacticaseibacillus rhamnosus TaxID=47715 RepID=UPI001E56A676|nr:hypothetical protein [Lacticaseibacillus rhamnosus]
MTSLEGSSPFVLSDPDSPMYVCVVVFLVDGVEEAFGVDCGVLDEREVDSDELDCEEGTFLLTEVADGTELLEGSDGRTEGFELLKGVEG